MLLPPPHRNPHPRTLPYSTVLSTLILLLAVGCLNVDYYIYIALAYACLGDICDKTELAILKLSFLFSDSVVMKA